MKRSPTPFLPSFERPSADTSLGQAMGQPRILIVSAALLVGAGSPAQAGFPGFAPEFVGTPYSVTVDVSGPGPHGFSFSGSAIDPDTGDMVTVRLSGSNLPFTRFQSTPGNPASFTVTGVGITDDERGTYTLGLAAEDDSAVGFVSGTGLRILVIPEPTLMCCAVSIAAFLAGRCRRCLSL